jgi:acyl carrier protein
MTKSEFYTEFETLLELDPGSIHGTETLSGISAWDSMGILSFMAFVDEKFGVVTEPEKLVKCQTIAELIGLFPGKIT